MRVVAGTAKGRKLKAPKAPGTRPVMDRVKTALFDILGRQVKGTRFLDLFAGTGSIGIEALSRGASAATFIELGPEALRCVRDNLAITGFTRQSEVLRTDAFKFLESAHAAGRRYDIVYVAPPQYHGLAAKALAQLDATPLTEPEGLVIVQVDPREGAEVRGVPLRHLRESDERRYGSTLLLFYEHAGDITEGEHDRHTEGRSEQAEQSSEEE